MTEVHEGVAAAYARGMSAFSVHTPMRLDEWADQFFYLSAESSYVEQRWTPWPFQRGIMSAMSHDDIREVDVQKSARVGYTKLLLAYICYNAHHRRRNQVIWQPTDDDRDEFVKTELEPALRDVEPMRDVFPAYLARHKDNTLQAKKFVGSTLHTKGGKAAKNYRRISPDAAMLDELDAFDSDVESEGDPVMLARKRIEGATFGKLICGSTPKLKGMSLIEKRAGMAKMTLRYQVTCPGCGGWHPLSWGGKDEPHGFRWAKTEDGAHQPETVRHLCPHCGAVHTQADYLNAWEAGRWGAADGSWMNNSAEFFDRDGERIRTPDHVAFVDLWTAYSPNVPWQNIVAEFLSAHQSATTGDDSKLKTFWNTTLARTWEGEIEQTEAEDLQSRAEPFPLRLIPRAVRLLLAGIDTQDNRLEVQVYGYGYGSEMWTIDSHVFFGNPSEADVWNQLSDFLFAHEYKTQDGESMRIHASAIDSGGHHTQAVYDFALRNKSRRVFAVKGRSGAEKHIKDGAAPVDLDYRGKRKKRGVVLWHVGTNHAKDLIHARLQVTQPGPGYIHFSNELSAEWFRQFTGEARATQKTPSGSISRWTAMRKRVEVLDCTVYAVWLEFHLDLKRKPKSWWGINDEETPAPKKTTQPATQSQEIPVPVERKRRIVRGVFR